MDMIEEPKYILYMSLQEEGGKIKDHPLRPFHLKIEAEWYLNGYVDAIANHTGNADSLTIEANVSEIYGQFSIRKIDDNDSDKEAKTVGVENK